jgi:cell division protein FtsW (lipid II flippase)
MSARPVERNRQVPSMAARNRELIALVPASLLLTAGFAGVFIQRSNVLSNVSLTYGAIFLGLCLLGHVVLRLTLPHADPYIFPLVAVLASFGIVMVYRINSTLARQQAQWFVLGLILFAATIIALRDYRKLERYRYTIMAVSLGLLVLPRLPGIGYSANGAYLGIRIPGLFVFQPAEFAKVGLVIFLASYLRDTRHVLATGGRRILGVTLPPIKHFGPIVVIWGLAMAIMVVLSDIGSSLMFYGALLAMLYVATGRVSFVVVGVVAFALGAWYLGTHIPHVHARVEDWLHPFNPHLYKASLGSYQIANGVFAQAAGGLFGQGFGRAVLTLPNGGPLVPAPQTDMIYAVITSELGLFGAAAVLVVYLLLVGRGLKAAVMARDSFSSLLATGLSAMLAIQVFVIVGGVTRVIPLTGVTLPFISYGGSSLIANFVLVALLLLVSDRAGRPARP